MSAVVDETIYKGLSYKSYSQQRYLRSHKKRNGETYLHRVIWSDHFGKIKDGHHIHHIDGNIKNNEINNLESVTCSEHNRNHGLEAEHLKTQERKDLLDKIRPLSHKWHKTEEGRKRLSEIALNKKKVEKVCEQCGVTYSTRNYSQSKYCSEKCGKRYRRSNGKNG